MILLGEVENALSIFTVETERFGSIDKIHRAAKCLVVLGLDKTRVDETNGIDVNERLR